MYLLENGTEPFPLMAHTPPPARVGSPVPLSTTINREFWPDLEIASVEAIEYTTSPRSVGRSSLSTTADPARYEGTLGGEVRQYYFDVTTLFGRTFRHPRFGRLQVSRWVPEPPAEPPHREE